MSTIDRHGWPQSGKREALGGVLSYLVFQTCVYSVLVYLAAESEVRFICGRPHVEAPSVFAVLSRRGTHQIASERAHVESVRVHHGGFEVFARRR